MFIPIRQKQLGNFTVSACAGFSVFINNTIDYKGVLFKKKYGNFSVFTLPVRVASVAAVFYLFMKIAYNLGDFLYSKIVVFETVGFHLGVKNLFLIHFI